MTGPLQGQSVLVVGRGSGIARAVTLAARDAGAKVVAAGRDKDTLAAAYAGEPAISTETVDLTDEASIAALGEQLGSVDHAVSTASARAWGRIADLDRDAIRLSFDTKVIGALMLAKHLAPRMNEGGSFVIFSGVAAAKIAVGTLGVGDHQRRRRRPGPLPGPGAGPDSSQRHLSRRDRHRRVGCPGRAR
jgi:NAD(P)-dependent dehydrogenase (short-subunit alcohol dehydrogenase family)